MVDFIKQNFLDRKKVYKLGDKFPLLLTGFIAFTSLISFLSNVILGIDNIVNYSGLIFFMWSLYILIFNKIEKHFLLFLIAVSLIYMPSVFIITEGFSGSNPIFLPILLFFIIIFFEQKVSYALSAILLCEYLFLSLLQIQNPSIFTYYATPFEKMTAMNITVILVFIIMGASTRSFLEIINSKENHNLNLLKEIRDRNQELYSLSIRDPLTSAYNRRYFLTAYENELERANMNSQELTVLMIDIDHFKQVNDTYGHIFGDAVLTRLVQFLHTKLRSNDLLARYGGEEFVVLLPNTSKENAMIIAERIREDVGYVKNRNNYVISLSIGLASSANESTAHGILNLADENLYKAKEAGRNRVVAD